MTEAMPMANPPTMRQKARSHSAKGSAEPMALMVKSDAEICMQRMRPMRSAMRPHGRGTDGTADQRDGDDLGQGRGADVVAAADGLDGAVDHGTVVTEQEAAHRGRRRDEDDMPEMFGVSRPGF